MLKITNWNKVYYKDKLGINGDLEDKWKLN